MAMSGEDFPQQLESLLGALQDSCFRELSIRTGDQKLKLKLKAPAPLPAPGPAAVTVASAADAEGQGPDLLLLKSPRVGHFYPRTGPKEGGKFRKGSTLRAGEVYGRIEAMHLRFELRAEVGGVLEQFLAAEGEAVEYGQPLVSLSPLPEEL